MSTSCYKNDRYMLNNESLCCTSISIYCCLRFIYCNDNECYQNIF